MMADRKVSQAEKFKQAARELETDQSEEAFDRVLKKVAKAPKPAGGRELRSGGIRNPKKS